MTPTAPPGTGAALRKIKRSMMDIDELIEAFILAYDAWCADEDHGMGGPTWDQMLEARARLEVEREKWLNENAKG